MEESKAFQAEEIAIKGGKTLSKPLYKYHQTETGRTVLVAVAGNQRYEIPLTSVLYIRDVVKAHQEHEDEE